MPVNPSCVVSEDVKKLLLNNLFVYYIVTLQITTALQNVGQASCDGRRQCPIWDVSDIMQPHSAWFFIQQCATVKL